MSAIACHDDTDLSEEALVESLVAAYGRDAITALRALLEDAEVIQNELGKASNMLSGGLAQGWQPGFQQRARK